MLVPPGTRIQGGGDGTLTRITFYRRIDQAGLSSLDPATVDALSRDLHAGVRRAVAFRRDLPPATIERLARDPSPFVREAIAVRPALPPHLVDELARGPWPGVRALLARHRST